LTAKRNRTRAPNARTIMVRRRRWMVRCMLASDPLHYKDQDASDDLKDVADADGSLGDLADLPNFAIVKHPSYRAEHEGEQTIPCRATAAAGSTGRDIAGGVRADAVDDARARAGPACYQEAVIVVAKPWILRGAGGVGGRLGQKLIAENGARGRLAPTGIRPQSREPRTRLRLRRRGLGRVGTHPRDNIVILRIPVTKLQRTGVGGLFLTPIVGRQDEPEFLQAALNLLLIDGGVVLDILPEIAIDMRIQSGGVHVAEQIVQWRDSRGVSRCRRGLPREDGTCDRKQSGCRL